MRYNKLGKTGMEISAIGFGCAPLGNEYGELDNQEAIRAIHVAIDAGINLFDTSTYYGRTLSETRLGEALKGKRDKVILATKGGRFDAPMDGGFDFSYKNIIQMCEASLQRLQTDYLDIYQLHDIEFGPWDVVLEEGIEALRDLKQQGKVRAIGVTGFPVQLLCDMIESQRLDLTLTYCHGNLMNERMNDNLIPAVKVRGLGIINASVTHMGILTHQGPQPWHPAPQAVKDAGAAAAKLCEERGASLPELAIQYALSNKWVDSTLLGTRTVAELENSITLLDKPIDQQLLGEVQKIIEPVKNMSWPSGHQMFWEADIEG